MVQKIEKNSSYGDLFTMEVFQTLVDDGSIMDYDGHGYYSDGEYSYDYADLENLDKSYAYVLWFNK